MSEPPWDADRAIYRQLRDAIARRMLEGSLQDGQALPSIRQAALQYQLNPLTVLKAYQQLVEEQLIEKLRGRGMFIRAGACAALHLAERQRFLGTEWPAIRRTIEQLGLSAEQLLQCPAAPSAADGAASAAD